MILTGPEIQKRMAEDEITIRPFDVQHLGPNSYNVHLDSELRYYKVVTLDPKSPIEASLKIIIPEEGHILTPGKLYLGRTVEYTESFKCAPMINGRSSLGRLGLGIHVTAGFGDVGFCGHWTLEMTCIIPIKVYPGMPIAQICFHETMGRLVQYSGRYNNNEGEPAIGSRLFYDWQDHDKAQAEIDELEVEIAERLALLINKGKKFSAIYVDVDAFRSLTMLQKTEIPIYAAPQGLIPYLRRPGLAGQMERTFWLKEVKKDEKHEKPNTP